MLLTLRKLQRHIVNQAWCYWHYVISSIILWTRLDATDIPSQVPKQPRPTSDGVIYGQYNERRIEYEEVLLSERTDSQYSQSESYLSERFVNNPLNQSDWFSLLN